MTASAGKDGALLELKRVGDIQGAFYVPRYQRGYRWGGEKGEEVDKLLDDIWEAAKKETQDSKGERYNLQPVVVKQRPKDEWELIDGQQRLTTLYLIFRCMQRKEILQGADLKYSITYETRLKSAEFLEDPDSGRSNENIDFFHIFNANECIRKWFEGRSKDDTVKFCEYLCTRVNVIWYKAPDSLDSTTLFTRLNVGRIPLTDAELVKALLLSRSRGGAGKPDCTLEVAAQWDSIERELWHPDIWAFVSGTSTEDSPTHITLLLDTLASRYKPLRGRGRPLFHTFETLREQIGKDSDSPKKMWEKVIELHAFVLGWYEDRDLYHKIGYLVAVGRRFGELVEEAWDRTKSSFKDWLDERIRERLNLTPSQVEELNYLDKRDECYKVLLLMNVETVRQMENSSERFPFHLHRPKDWSLEHIHARNAEPLKREEQRRKWLELHREALLALSNVNEEQRDALIKNIDVLLKDDIGQEDFHNLAGEVTEFTLGDEPNSISNLALLTKSANSALGNSEFEDKRSRILKLHKKGKYIPVCTRRVFLKYYSDAHQIDFWGPQDRDSYLDAMRSSNGGIGKYLKPEEEE